MPEQVGSYPSLHMPELTNACTPMQDLADKINESVGTYMCLYLATQVPAPLRSIIRWAEAIGVQIHVHVGYAYTQEGINYYLVREPPRALSHG